MIAIPFLGENPDWGNGYHTQERHMGALLQKMVMLLWPFILEVFVNNPDVRKSFKKNKLLIGVVFVLLVVTLTYFKTSDSNHQANVRYQDMTQSFIDLETRYRELWDRRNELRNRLNDVYGQLDVMEAQVRDVMRKNRELKAENETSTEEPEDPESAAHSRPVCPEPPEAPRAPVRRSRVTEYLNEIGA